MSQKIVKALSDYLTRQNINGEDRMYLHIFSFVAAFFCVIVHVILLVIFMSFGVSFYVYINIGSVCIYTLALIWHHKRRYTITMVLVSLEVIIYATVFICFSGVTTYIAGYYLVILVLHSLMPYAIDKARIAINLGIIVIAVCVVIYGFNIQPGIIIPDDLGLVITVANILIQFLAAVILLYMGQFIRLIINHINQLRVLELSDMANTDPLTGLFNRRYADRYFAEIISSGKDETYCVAMMDIDDFKHVNDTYGHDCGDEVLIYLSNLFSQNLRSSDMLFRWGGEEFLMILKNVDVATAYTILDKLRQRLADAIIQTKPAPVSITVTIGVAVLDKDDYEGSIKKCDDNLYAGKKGTKNVVVI